MSTSDRLLDAAQAILEESGWSSITMAAIGARAGVSRQTVYNQFGTKHQLAQLLALRELQRFLEVVRAQLATEPDVIEAIRAASLRVLVLAEQSLVVRTIMGSGPGDHDPDLVSILTTESGDIMEAAHAAVKSSLEEFHPSFPLRGHDLDVAVEVVVRLVLSAITRPSKPVADAADDIAWVAGMAVRAVREESPLA